MYIISHLLPRWFFFPYNNVLPYKFNKSSLDNLELIKMYVIFLLMEDFMKKVIHVSIDEDLCKELKVAAYEKHFSLSAVINSALNDFNEKLKNDELKQDMTLNVSLNIFKRTRKNKK